ncbi:Uncharacterized protein TCM_005437 [Theobroma cacao]|uniref:Uncharacterized protein n=1 Tax=Theobroma cacao TaxID=3641 RepID=A0A061DVM1_THECC|nr:Uncharacterized protein TCM_005437 [Theobroma cacao]
MSGSVGEITEETTSSPLLEGEDGAKTRPREPYWKGETVKSIVYAGLVAIVTYFSPISSVSASQLSFGKWRDITEPSLGDFLSTSTKKDLAVKERAVTEWDAIKDQQQQLLQHLRIPWHGRRRGQHDNDLAISIGACFMSAFALSLLGIARAKIAGKNYARSVGIVLLNGAVAAAAAAAYSLGWVLRDVAGFEEPIKTKVE